MENLDDKTGGRVTRSLRKRMSSVDSETSSRPGTPIGIKLSSINEIISSDSPSRSTRKTRRNSIIETITPAKTPSKSTALKRLDTPDPVNSSMRRLTRRLSVSISEDDQLLQTSKPKLQFNPLPEEDGTQLIYKPLPGSSSKLPVELTKNGEPKDSLPKLLIKSKSKSTPEKRLQTGGINCGSSDGAISDVEVVVLGSGDETEPEGKMLISQKSKQDICELVSGSDTKSLLDISVNVFENQKATKADDSSKLAKIAEKNLTKNEELNIKESTKINMENVKKAKEKESVEVNNKTSEEVSKEGYNAKLNQGKNDSVNLTSKQNNFEKANVSASKRNKSVNINQEKQLTPTVMLKRLSGSEDPRAYVHKKNNSFTLFDTKRNEFESLKVVANESGKKEELKITRPRPLGGHSKSNSYVDEVSLKDDVKKLSFQEKPSIQNNGDQNSEEDSNDARMTVIEGNHSNCEVLPETSAPYNPELVGELKCSTPIVFPRRSYTESDSIKQSNSINDKTTPKHSSNISSSITQGNNVGKKMRARKEVLISPDKLLRSGKIYGNSPPTIIDPKNRSTTPVLEIKSPENNGAISKLVTQKPHEMEKDIVAIANPMDGNSPPITTIIDTPKKRSTTPVLELKSPENNGAISKLVTQKPHEIEKDIAAADNPIDGNSSPLTTIIDTPKKRRSTQVLEINSPENSDTISKSVAQKPHQNETDIDAADNATDGKSPPTTTIIEIPKKRRSTQVSEMNSPENNGTISISVIQKPRENEKDIVAAENPTGKENNKKETAFVTSWSHNVSGKADESTKIDVVKKITDIVQRTTIIDCQDTSLEFTKNKLSRYESDDNEDDLGTDNADIVKKKEEDDEEVVELAKDESHYIQHPFVEDEAMEVDDSYESGDSLYSEERREIEENEIHDNGESIGSEDTEEAPGDDVVDDDDEDSFIVNDLEVLNSSDDDEHMEITETVQNRSKNYKRIKILDSSDSEENQGEQVNMEKSNNINHTILNSYEIANGNEEFDNKHHIEELPKECQDCEVLDSTTTLGEEEDTNQLSNKPNRKSFNKSKQALIKDCLLSSSNECLNVKENSDKDEIKIRIDCINQFNDSIANTSKLSACAKGLLERNDSVSASGSDLENETDQKHLSHTRKSIKFSNQSNNLIETLHEVNKDNQETSSEIENEVDDDTSENSRRVTLNNSTTSNNSVQFSNSTSSEKLICEASNNTNTNNEMEDNSRKEDKNSGERLNAQEIDVLEKSTSGSNDINILRYETDSDEEEEQAISKPLSTTTKCKVKKERKKKKTSIKESSHVEKFSSDESTNKIDQKDVASEIDIGWVQQKPSKNNNLSASFGYFDQEKNRKITKSLNGSLKYIKKVEEEVNEEEKPLNISHKKDILKHSKTPSQRQSLGSPTTHPDLLLSDKSNHESICMTNSNTEYNPSASCVEKVAEHNQVMENQSKKRKRLSKSFSLCGSLDTGVGDQVHHLNKKSKITQIERVNSSTPLGKNKRDNNNLQHILGRCEEILEAANRVKLEAKQNYTKNKMRKRKTKHLNVSPKATDDVEKIQSPTELKNDDRKKGQITQAIKAATDLLLGKPTNSIADCQLSHPTLELKHFSKTVINPSDLEPSHVKYKETEGFTSTVVNDGKNLKHAYVFQSSAGEVLEIPLQKQLKKPTRTTKIELSTGTICVEPVTPTKQYNLNGFHESPMTPRRLGFKVRKILTPGQDALPKITSEAQRKKRNRNQYNYEEPEKTLPKPQWTQSGVFIEEDLSSRRIKHSGSTQFLVSALNRARKTKNLGSSKNVEAPISNALQFKKNYLFRGNVPRESSRDFLQRKERKPHC